MINPNYGRKKKKPPQKPLLFISQNPQVGALTEEQMGKIESEIVPLSPKGNLLTRVVVAELNRTPFFFGAGGFNCSKCDIHSNNLVNKFAYFSAKENYCLCCLCAENIKDRRKEFLIQAQIDARLAKSAEAISKIDMGSAFLPGYNRENTPSPQTRCQKLKVTLRRQQTEPIPQSEWGNYAVPPTPHPSQLKGGMFK